MAKRREISPSEFALQGGPLHDAGTRLGLVRHDTNATGLGLAIGGACWVALMLALLAEGRDPFTLTYLDIHVRFLVAVPLLFAFESIFHPQVAQFVHGLARADILPAGQLVLLRRSFRSLRRLRNGVTIEASCLLLALGVTLAVPLGYLSGIEHHASHGAEAGFSLLGLAYLAGMTVFRFVLLRWIVGFLAWCWVLWRLSRLPLQLKPSHIDRTGGLGQLELVQAQFVPVMFAISTVASASFAVDIAAGRLTLEGVVPTVVALLVFDALLFVAPLGLFTPKLWACRIRGLHDFARLNAACARDFERKWVANQGEGDALLGTPDMSTYADLGAVVDAVHHMRVFPMTTKMAGAMATAILVPLLPLILFEYPGVVLIQQFLARLAGL